MMVSIGMQMMIIYPGNPVLVDDELDCNLTVLRKVSNTPE